MKIVQFISRMDVLGGAQTHVFDLTTGLVARGHDVSVISHGTGILTEELANIGVDYYPSERLKQPIHPIHDVRALFEVIKIIKQINPDIIAIHSSKAGAIGRIVGKYLRIPTVFTSHSWSFSGVTKPLKQNAYILIERIFGTLSTGIITVSHCDYVDGKKYKIAKHVDMKIIHNGIHDLAMSSHIKKEADDRIHFVMVARFAYPKDHLLLLLALKDIPLKNWRLTLIGDGPDIEKIKAFANQCGLAEHITFPGEVRNVDDYLYEADVFILLTKSESLPISIIEAMRAGLATIASDVGGIKELIDDQQTGIIVKNNDVESARTAITTLLTNTSARKEFGVAARRKFKKEFTFSKMLHETELYYEQIVMDYHIKNTDIRERVNVPDTNDRGREDFL